MHGLRNIAEKLPDGNNLLESIKFIHTGVEYVTKRYKKLKRRLKRCIKSKSKEKVDTTQGSILYDKFCWYRMDKRKVWANGDWDKIRKNKR